MIAFKISHRPSLYNYCTLSSSPSTMGSMKVHQFARGSFWDHHEPSLTLGCKRLRPLAPKLANTDNTPTSTLPAAFDLKSFIKPESGPRKLGSSDDKRDSPAQVLHSTIHFYTYIFYNNSHSTYVKYLYQASCSSTNDFTKHHIPCRKESAV